MSPERVVVCLFVVLFAIGAASGMSGSSGPYHRAFELLFYAWTAFFGAAYVFLVLREGYCISLPEATRENSPIFFWTEVAFACGMAMVGLRLLWAAL